MCAKSDFIKFYFLKLHDPIHSFSLRKIVLLIIIMNKRICHCHELFIIVVLVLTQGFYSLLSLSYSNFLIQAN